MLLRGFNVKFNVNVNVNDNFSDKSIMDSRARFQTEKKKTKLSKIRKVSLRGVNVNVVDKS